MNPFLVLALAAAAAAAPTPPAPPPPLDCAKGFERLVVLARGVSGATAVQAPRGSTMQAVSIQTGGVLTVYSFTEPTHAAHPFITRRRMIQGAGRVSVDMSSCPYGDAAQGAMLTTQFTRMNDAFVRQVSTPGAPPTK